MAMAQPLILVVEDNPRTQEALRQELTKDGCAVEIVGSAELAIERLRLKPEPDVVVLDFILPGKNGPWLFQQAMKEGITQRLRFVPFTQEVNRPRMPEKDAVDEFRMIQQSVPAEESPHPIIPKFENDKEIPLELLLSVMHGIRKRGVALPSIMVDHMRRLLKEKEDGGKGEEGK
jgi:CheY-like chemotaxis protein